MKVKEKIEKKIKDKELQLSWLEKSNKKLKKQDEKNFDEDLKFKNTINPFYKRKYKNPFGKDIFMTMLECNLKSEIEELKKLIK